MALRGLLEGASPSEARMRAEIRLSPGKDVGAKRRSGSLSVDGSSFPCIRTSISYLASQRWEFL